MLTLHGLIQQFVQPAESDSDDEDEDEQQQQKWNCSMQRAALTLHAVPLIYMALRMQRMRPAMQHNR